jgi:UDP-glucuronate 4-epimerase
MDMIAMLEKATGHKANMVMKPMQPGDVHATYADTTDLARDIGFKPSTPLQDGLDRFVSWYKNYHQL